MPDENENAARVREPLVDGLFYPADAAELRRTIGRLIRHSASSETQALEARAIICPSASYDYVGTTMAAAYRRIATPSHPVAIVIAAGQHVDEGQAALPSSDWYRTPLGYVPIEGSLRTRLCTELPDRFVEDDLVHLEEHAVETQLPFLQFMLDSLTIVPILVGRCDEDAVNEMKGTLRASLADFARPQLLVLGTNLTSYQSRDEARREGTRLLDLISSGKWREVLSPRTAFTIGHAARAAVALFLATLGDGAGCATLARANSSRSTGDPSTTVEYASCACSMFDEGR